MNINFIMGLSGGLDSATLLALLSAGLVGEKVEFKTTSDIDSVKIHCFNFNYGSRHNKYEREAARKLADYYKVHKYIELDLQPIFSNFNINSSSLLQGSEQEIPETDHLAPETRTTVVPGRNTIMLSIMMGYGESLIQEDNDISVVVFGAHEGDRQNYPDCRSEYVEFLSGAFFEATEGKVILLAPFIENMIKIAGDNQEASIDKQGIVEIAEALEVPFELTRTCYRDQEIACGRCPSCIERLEAFMKNDLIDPIKYEQYPDFYEKFLKEKEQSKE